MLQWQQWFFISLLWSYVLIQILFLLIWSGFTKEVSQQHKLELLHYLKSFCLYLWLVAFLQLNKQTNKKKKPKSINKQCNKQHNVCLWSVLLLLWIRKENIRHVFSEGGAFRMSVCCRWVGCMETERWGSGKDFPGVTRGGLGLASGGFILPSISWGAAWGARSSKSPAVLSVCNCDEKVL